MLRHHRPIQSTDLKSILLYCNKHDSVIQREAVVHCHTGRHVKMIFFLNPGIPD